MPRTNDTPRAAFRASFFPTAAAALLLASVATAAVVSSGCATCGRCAYALQLDVILATADAELQADDPAVLCGRVDGRVFQCTADYEPGDYAIVLSADGHEDRTVTFTVGPYTGGGLGCSPCPGQHYERIELTSTAPPPALDAGVGDAG